MERYDGAVERYGGVVERYGGAVERYDGAVERYDGAVERYGGAVERYDGAVERYDGAVERYGGAVECNEHVSQFVSAVTAFSSQYGTIGSLSYSNANLAGGPTRFPEYGDFASSAAVGTYGQWWNDLPSSQRPFGNAHSDVSSDDFIDVDFATPVYPLRVGIYECHKPGAVVRISALVDDADDTGSGRPQWLVLWRGEPQLCCPRSRIFQPMLCLCQRRTSRLRIELNCRRLDYFTGLEAVQLIGCRHRPTTNQMLAGRSPGPITRRLRALQLSVDTRLDEPNRQRHLLDLVETISSEYARVESPHATTDSSQFLSLPEEILIGILTLLDLVSLSRLASSCMQMKRLCSDPMLYNDLNLQFYWYMADDRLMRFLMKRHCVSRLDLSWCGNYSAITPTEFCSVAGHLGSGLVALRVNCCDWFDNVCLEWTGLFCRSLEELSLRGCLSVEDDSFWSLQYLCSLRHLDLYRTQVTVAPLVSCVRNATCLQFLGLGHCMRLQRVSAVCLALADCCPDLRSLVLWRVPDVSWSCLRLLRACHTLQELDIGWCKNVLHDADMPMLATIVTHLPALRRLDLSSLRLVQDGDIVEISRSCPLLEQLILLGANLLKPESIERLLVECAELRLLDVSYCAHISHQHASVWRAHHPHCTVQIHGER